MLCGVYVWVCILFWECKWMQISVCSLMECKSRRWLWTGHLGRRNLNCRVLTISGLSQAVEIGDRGGVADGLKEFILERRGKESFSLHLHFLSLCYSWAFRKILFKHSSTISSCSTDYEGRFMCLHLDQKEMGKKRPFPPLMITVVALVPKEREMFIEVVNWGYKHHGYKSSFPTPTQKRRLPLP